MFISIDGSSRRNGKPDCNAAGSAYIREKGALCYAHEFGSTNQCGELMGAIQGLTAAYAYALDGQEDFVIVTDSEYVFNMIRNGWTYTWSRSDWRGSNGEVVKNKHHIEKLHGLLERLDYLEVEVVMFHIKGHLVSLGDVTARKLLDADATGEELYKAASNKYEVRKKSHPHLFENAYEVFKKNNGDMVPEETFKEIVLLNTVADYAASMYMNKVDAAYHANKAE